MITARLAARDLRRHPGRTTVGILLFALPITIILTGIFFIWNDPADQHAAEPHSRYYSVEASPNWCYASDSNTGCHDEVDALVATTPVRSHAEHVFKQRLYPATHANLTWQLPDGGTAKHQVLIVDPELPGAPAPHTAIIPPNVLHDTGINAGSRFTGTLTPDNAAHPKNQYLNTGWRRDPNAPHGVRYDPDNAPKREPRPLPKPHTGQFTAVTDDAPTGAQQPIIIAGDKANPLWQQLITYTTLPRMELPHTLTFLTPHKLTTLPDSDSSHEARSTYGIYAPTAPDGDHSPGLRSALRQLIALSKSDVGFLLLYPTSSLMPWLLTILLAASSITPFFAVAVRRNTRQIGLLTAQGATPRHIARIFHWQGLFIGILGTLVGLAGAAISATLIKVFLNWPTKPVYWPLDITALLCFTAGLVGISAAFIPARKAAYSQPVLALSGGKPAATPKLGKSTIVAAASLSIALAISIISMLAVRYQANVPSLLDSFFPSLILPLFFFALAAVFSGPAIIWLTARLFTRLPITGALALKDTWRTVTRTGPAVGAIAGITFCATCYGILLYGSNFAASAVTGKNMPDRYVAVTADNTVEATTSYPARTQLATADALLGDIPTFDYYSTYADTFEAQTELLPAKRTTSPGGSTAAEELPEGYWDSPGFPGANQPLIIAPPTIAESLSDNAETRGRITTALQRGEAVAIGDKFTADNRIAIARYTNADYQNDSTKRTTPDGKFIGYGSTPSQLTYVPATVINTDLALSNCVIITPEIARDHHIDYRWAGRIYNLNHPPSLITLGKMAAISNKEGRQPHFFASRTNINAVALSAGLWIPWLIAAGITTLILALSAAETRRDLTLLSAIGASPTTVRRFLPTQGLIISALGTLTGTALGVLNVLSYERMLSGDLELNSTTSHLLITGLCAVVVPLISWCTGFLLARKMKPDQRMLEF